MKNGWPVPRHALPLVAALWLAAMALLAAFGSAALAEGDSTVQSWRVIQSGPRVTAPSGQGQTYRARRRYDTPRPRYPDEAALGLVMPDITVTPPDPAEGSRPKVLVMGDSLADALASGFMADPGIKADLSIQSKTVSASGLVRDDFHDWSRHMRDMLAATPDAAVIIVMLGLNDRQAMRAGDASLEPMSEGWLEQYRQRVDTLVRIAQQARVPLVWVGMPVMRSAKLSQDLASLNALVRDRVTQSGETFVETFDGFADSGGGFTATGPDVIGDTVRLRGPDGIHFTPAGQRKLAFFVEKPVRLRLGDRLQGTPATPVPPTSAPALAAPPDSPSPPVASLPPTERTVPPPQVAPVEPVRIRPDIGEIRPLSTQNTATSLAGMRAPAIADPVTRDLFDKGISPAARAGRTDDYRWR